MSKEKNSKFTECYNELLLNENLRRELSKLSGNKFKAKLIETFPTIDITGHFIRKARELLKASIETYSGKSTSNQNINDKKADTFKEVASDKEYDSTDNNNDTIKEDSIAGAISDANTIEKTKDFNDVNYNLLLTSNSTLNEVNSVLTDKNNIKTIDEMIIATNTLKKEIENKSSDIELLKSQLNSAYERIKSLSMDNEEKQKEILTIQNSYDITSDNCCNITLHRDMIRDLKSVYVTSKVINSDTFVINDIDSATYCIKKAISEAIYTYGDKK